MVINKINFLSRRFCIFYYLLMLLSNTPLALSAGDNEGAIASGGEEVKTRVDLHHITMHILGIYQLFYTYKPSHILATNAMYASIYGFHPSFNHEDCSSIKCFYCDNEVDLSCADNLNNLRCFADYFHKPSCVFKCSYEERQNKILNNNELLKFKEIARNFNCLFLDGYDENLYFFVIPFVEKYYDHNIRTRRHGLAQERFNHNSEAASALVNNGGPEPEQMNIAMSGSELLDRNTFSSTTYREISGNQTLSSYNKTTSNSSGDPLRSLMFEIICKPLQKQLKREVCKLQILPIIDKAIMLIRDDDHEYLTGNITLITEIHEDSSNLCYAFVCSLLDETEISNIQMEVQSQNTHTLLVAEKLNSEDDATKIKTLVMENNNLKDIYTCKICLDEKVSILFLPCAHIACCRNCSSSLRKCPICRVYIKSVQVIKDMIAPYDK
ncbi:MAG: RING-HC finger protein [Candidatus Endonucleobacter sp. (ex Gigantidas childressi)]|nr:RING-HC finger protein [Candidatus Endonucleobacter sp. (ex Gigantidas childressi)]